MTDQEIKDRLKKEINAETPDIWETLRDECSFLSPEVRTERKKTKLNRWRHLYTSLTTAAAVFAFVVALELFSGTSMAVRFGRTQEPDAVEETVIREPAAIVGIDVNPSIEMEIDADSRVIGCTAVNSDADMIISGMDLTGSDVTVAAYALVGSMLTHGYLTDVSNSILVSVTAEESEKGRMLEELLSQELNGFLENSQINAAIIGQYLKTDAVTEEFAREHEISVGKARIIKTLAAERGDLTEETLLKLSTQELLLLWTGAQESGAYRASETNDDMAFTVYGQVSTDGYISAYEAETVALKTVGAKSEKIDRLETEYDCYGGMIVYEVEFVFADIEYEVKIHATTGEVLSVEKETADADADDDDDDDEDDDDD